MQHGEIVSTTEAEIYSTNRTVLEISDGEMTVTAVFVRRGSRWNNPELAAYRLDRFLELDMVPVTVKRPLGKTAGSVQFLPRNTSNEKVRTETGRGGGAWCPLNDQWKAMYVFDALIHNAARTKTRMLYNLENWQLMLTAHDRAFATSHNRPPHLASAPIDVTPGWKEKLEALDAATIDEIFGDILDRSRRRALLARRNELLDGGLR